MFSFSTRRYPLGSSSFLYPRDGFPPTGDDRQLADSITICILDELIMAYPQHGASSSLSGTSIQQLSRASRMRSRRLEHDARPAPSIATVVTPKVKERAKRGNRIARRSRTGKHLPMGQVTPLGVVIPLRNASKSPPICPSRRATVHRAIVALPPRCGLSS